MQTCFANFNHWPRSACRANKSGEIGKDSYVMRWRNHVASAGLPSKTIDSFVRAWDAEKHQTVYTVTYTDQTTEVLDSSIGIWLSNPNDSLLRR